MKTTKIALITTMILFPILYVSAFYLLTFVYLVNISGQPLILNGAGSLWVILFPLGFFAFMPRVYKAFCRELASLFVKLDLPPVDSEADKNARATRLLEYREIVMKSWTHPELKSALQLFEEVKRMINENEINEKMNLRYSLGILKGKVLMLSKMSPGTKISIITDNPDEWKKTMENIPHEIIPITPKA